jgi:hypothetical protein
MDELVRIVAGLVLGAGASAVFFLGLAATVGRMADTRRPGALVAVSLVLRVVLLAAIVAAAAALGAAALIAAIVALLATRVLLVRYVAGGGGRWT